MWGMSGDASIYLLLGLNDLSIGLSITARTTIKSSQSGMCISALLKISC